MRVPALASFSVEIQAAGDEVLFQQEVLALLPLFWGGRDVRHLHHPVWFRQFGETALAARDAHGALCGYMPGAATPLGGYAHAVATLPEMRGHDVGRSLYARFAADVLARGGRAAEAITLPTNSGSIAFHQRLGFSAVLVADYAGPGEDRVHFRADAQMLLEP